MEGEGGKAVEVVQDGQLSWLMPTGLSGDPLLKRLIDLANLGWRTELAMLSNGAVIRGTLISPSEFRAVLADSIQSGDADDPAYQVLREMVAHAVLAEDPDPVPLGRPSDVPEPRFIHLADVTINDKDQLPFIRLRLPAVSGFWLANRRQDLGGGT
jgi:hypothetical protein